MKLFLPVLSILTAGLLLIGAGQAVAAGNVSLVSKAQLEKVTVNEKGEKEITLVPAEKVLPGEIVRFTNTYTNDGAEAAEAVVITNPVPAQMTYLDASAFGNGTVVTYSVDGGRTFGPLADLTVPGADGKPRPATAADVTQIRWTLQQPVPPQGSGEVGYRARLK